MTNTVTFFSKEEDLRTLTGLDHKGLWDNGFNLDDWDFGFVSNDEWNADGWPFGDGPLHQCWLLERMGNYCVGYEHTEYGGKHYYIAYHS